MAVKTIYRVTLPLLFALTHFTSHFLLSGAVTMVEPLGLLI